MKNISVGSFLILFTGMAMGQTQLALPSTIETNTINLTLQEGVTQFYPGVNTNTLGANGSLLGPTLIMNQGDNVSITVDNQLSDTTTIHWHGMHVSPENDGGPHSIILPGDTWNPQFTVLDKAGLYWYHPHLHMHTDKHVSKGIAGVIIVRDAEEGALNLPSTYGVDEFPLILQTKGFDATGQILVHTDLDTSVMTNGTVDAITDFPAQVVRLRVLNGSSQRVMEIGFSDNRSFSLIGTDGGLLTAPITMTRYRMAPGQRADILLDLSTSLGQNFQLMSFGSELPNAIYGATQPGMGPGATSSLPNYTSNPLNGNDYQFLDITVGTPSASPVMTIPSSLAVYTPIPEGAASTTRTLTFTSTGGMNNLNGPFVINGSTYDMGVMNYTIPLNNIEIWSITNSTPIAHPFHIHDVQFSILDINGVQPPPALRGFHDVILVPAGMGNIRFITQFNDFASDTVPFMYHCHMLPHEDGGMMGQFLVTDINADLTQNNHFNLNIYPNPSAAGEVQIELGDYSGEIVINDVFGRIVHTQFVESNTKLRMDLDAGVYYIHNGLGESKSFVIQ